MHKLLANGVSYQTDNQLAMNDFKNTGRKYQTTVRTTRKFGDCALDFGSIANRDGDRSGVKGRPK
jgi:hypothetical protein